MTSRISGMGLLFLLCVGVGSADTDPRATRNMVSDATQLPAQLTENRVLWKHEMKSKHAYSQPVITGDKVLVGISARKLDRTRYTKKNQGALLCLDRKTGEMLWRLVFRDGPWWAGHGVTSTPWVEGEKVYLISPVGHAMCIDLNGMANGNDGPYQKEAELMGIPGELIETDGDVIWAYDFSRKLKISAHDSYCSHPLILNDMFVFATGHAKGVKPTPAWTKEKDWDKWKYSHSPNLAVLDKNTGTLLAVDEIDVPQVYHGQWSSPALATVEDKPLIIWGDGNGNLYGLELPEAGQEGQVGKLKTRWKFDMNPPEFREKPFPLHHTKNQDKIVGPSHVIGIPVVRNDRVFIGTGRDHFYAGKEKGRIITEGMFYCIDPSGEGDITESGKVWGTRMTVTHSTASIINGLILLADEGGTVRCLDEKTGETYWEHELDADVTCRSQFVADGKIYVSTDKRGFEILKAAKEKEVLWKGKLDEQAATVGVTDGLLIVATGKSVTAYAAEPQAQTEASTEN